VNPNKSFGGSKGVCPFGRRAKAREGEAGSSSDRWKGEILDFSLQVIDVGIE